MRLPIPVSLAATVALALVASSASAASPYASCSKNADGSGQCSGNFVGFASTGNAAYFEDYDGYEAIFWARFNGGYYACAAMNPIPLWDQAASLGPTVMFNVDFDASGHCTFVSFQNTSW
jgi:hypothetical protein